MVKQLSSIGSKTYLSSHKSPYGGNKFAIKALSNNECQELWASIREENYDRTCPAFKGGPDVFVYINEDEGTEVKPLAKQEPEDPKLRAQQALSRRSTSRRRRLVENKDKQKVLVSILGKKGVGQELLREEERQQKVADWDKWVQDHFQDILDALNQTNEAPKEPVTTSTAEASGAERAEALLYVEPTLAMSEVQFTAAELRA
mgnify:FL=1